MIFKLFGSRPVIQGLQRPGPTHEKRSQKYLGRLRTTTVSEMVRKKYQLANNKKRYGKTAAEVIKMDSRAVVVANSKKTFFRA